MKIFDYLKNNAKSQLQESSKLLKKFAKGDLDGMLETALLGDDPLLNAKIKSEEHRLAIAHEIIKKMTTENDKFYKEKLLEHVSVLEKTKPGEAYYLLAMAYQFGLPRDTGKLFPKDEEKYNYYADLSEKNGGSLYAYYYFLENEYPNAPRDKKETYLRKIEELSEKGLGVATQFVAYVKYLDPVTHDVTNYEECMKLLELSSSQGYPNAIYFLSLLYQEKGDNITAAKYFHKAVKEGCYDAKKNTGQFILRPLAMGMQRASGGNVPNNYRQSNNNNYNSYNNDNYYADPNKYNYEANNNTDNYNDNYFYNSNKIFEEGAADGANGIAPTSYDPNYMDGYNSYDNNNYNDAYNDGARDALNGNYQSSYDRAYQEGYEENLSYEQWDKYRNGEDPFNNY